MSRWLPLAVAVAGAFAAYNLLMKAASSRIDQVPGAVVLQLVAAAAGAVALAALWASGQPIRATWSGAGYAAAAGLAVGLAEIGTFLVFARGAPVSLASPVIMGGSVLLGAGLGVAVLREALTPAQGLGVALIAAGIALVSGGGRGP